MRTTRTSTTTSAARSVAAAALLVTLVPTAAHTASASVEGGSTGRAAPPAGGPGWSVSSTRPSGTPGWQGDSLVVASPGGTRYPVAGRIGRGEQVTDVSSDARRVLTARRGEASTVLTTRDLRTGTSQSFTVASSWSEARFLDDAGSKVLAVSGEDGKERVEARTPSGTLLRTVHSPTRGRLAGTPISSSDGRTVVLARSGSIRVLDAATGATTKTLTTPSGYADCLPTRWWATGVVTARCTATSGSLKGTYQVFKMGLDGTRTGVTTSQRRPPIGWGDAWYDRTGVVALDLAGCGPATPTRLVKGSPRITFGGSGPAVLLTVTGGRAYALRQDSECDLPRRSLVAKDLASGRTTVVVDQVQSSAVVDPRQ